jgi:hypothetical protein
MRNLTAALAKISSKHGPQRAPSATIDIGAFIDLRGDPIFYFVLEAAMATNAELIAASPRLAGTNPP